MALFLQAHATHPDWRMALGLSLAQLHAQSDAWAARAAAGGAELEPFTLGWCYVTDHYAGHGEAIVAELHERVPGVSWVGAVGAGVSACGVEYLDEPALVLMLSTLPRGHFRIFSGRQAWPAPGSGFVAHTALVHADGHTPDLGELLPELAERTTTGYLFGGLAVSRAPSLQAWHLADAVFSGGLSGVAFDAEVDVVSRVTQGCQPIGPARVITECEGNLVISLDGEPALDCLLRDLGVVGDMAAELPQRELLPRLRTTLAGLTPAGADALARPGQFGTDTRVRHLVGLEPLRRGLAVAESAERGARLAFCTRNPQAARLDLTRIATEIREEIEGDEGGAPRRVAGALYVSCSGRGGAHFGAPHAELRTVRQALGEVPLVGFFAGGEIARQHVYGYTGVLTVFTAPA
ncbi:FIST N-terminal domain-containing protein [Aquabacterium sp.]|uniref:FIST signal transduction protein n=1 Tax=Aquabacterium sp. TaxID=1872578 RepID=UPI0035B3F747